jgi:hypothetical protein
MTGSNLSATRSAGMVIPSAIVCVLITIMVVSSAHPVFGTRLVRKALGGRVSEYPYEC